MNYYFLKNKVSGKSDYLLGQLATKAETIRTPVDSLHEWVSINEVEAKVKELEAENKILRSFLYDLANMISGGDEDYACREITQWHREQGHD